MSKLHEEMENLIHWANVNIAEMECREDEDCDHCLGLQVLSAARLALIDELMTGDPTKETERGRMLLRVATQQEAYEKIAYPEWNRDSR